MATVEPRTDLALTKFVPYVPYVSSIISILAKEWPFNNGTAEYVFIYGDVSMAYLMCE